MKILIVVIIILAVAAFFVYRKKTNSFPVKVKKSYEKGNVNIERADLSRELSFVSDVVPYFKSLSLNPQTDTPFIIDGSKLSALLVNITPSSATSLMLGVYHELTDEISNVKLINATSFDAQTQEVLAKSEDGIVALK